MTNNTTNNGTKCVCKNGSCSKEFMVIGQEVQFYRDKKLPLPDVCPSCRHKQRMALRSERQMYRRTCDKCSESMLSVYPEDAPYKVYCQKCFWENVE